MSSPLWSTHAGWSVLLLLGSTSACGPYEETEPPATTTTTTSSGASTGGCVDPDGDDVCDPEDNCPADWNSQQLDADDDGIGDACDEPMVDPCAEEGGDADGDEACDFSDNCVSTPNADQADGDEDGLGDACDPTQGTNVCAGNGGDPDDDDVCQAWDNCPGEPNPAQGDADDDGVGDVCDATPEPCDDLGGDQDGDTVCDQLDNCPQTSNVNQLDADLDGVGDICDPTPPIDPNSPCAGFGGDFDSDGWCAYVDNCPTAPNSSQADVDGDGTGDVCDPESCDGEDNDGDGQADNGFPNVDGDSFADCVDPCPLEPEADQDGDGTDDCVDVCPNDPDDDADNDNICGDTDNCPQVSSSNQGDKDGDGIGDVCDVEECDGISNDVDSQIDEGMPDADDDGTCDDIDACPNDPGDDAEADGFCAADDHCPTVANPTQADADGDDWGDACDIDSASACSAPASLNAPGVALPALTIGDAVADPTLNRVYLSVRSTSANLASQLVAVDVSPAGVKTVAWSLPVGSDPQWLAISADGSILYVALQGSGSVRMVNVPNRTACLSFPVGTDPNFGTLRAGDLDVLPGVATSVLISRRFTGLSPDFAGAFVYDQGVARPVGTPGGSRARMISIASDSLAYGFNNASTGFQLYELAIGPDGVEEVWAQQLFSGFNTDILYEDGLVYTTTGVIVEPVVPALAGTFSGAAGPVAVDSTFNEAYFANSATLVKVFDTTTQLFERDVVMSGATGTPIRLVRWGATGLALVTSNGLAVSASAAGL